MDFKTFVMTENVHNFAIKAFIDDTSLVVPQQFDIGGGCVYVGFIIICLTYVLYKLVLVKQSKLRRDGDPLLKGAVRWAAAAGDLQILNDLSFAPAFDVDSELNGFNALHAAAVAGKRGKQGRELKKQYSNGLGTGPNLVCQK